MTTVRRRVLRGPVTSPVDPRQARRRERRQAELQRERAALARWLARLRRALRAVERHQSQIVRIEKRISQDAAN